MATPGDYLKRDNCSTVSTNTPRAGGKIAPARPAPWRCGQPQSAAGVRPGIRGLACHPGSPMAAATGRERAWSVGGNGSLGQPRRHVPSNCATVS